MHRRTYLSLLGTSAFSVATTTPREPPPYRVPVPTNRHSEWSLQFEDRFDRSRLGSEWEIGWGWGRRTTTSSTVASTENVSVSESSLHLRGTHDGTAIRSGVVNTKDSVTFEPGSYLEASIRFADRRGFLNAFWSKPNSEKWPPEIDVVELWQESNGRDDTRRSRHHLHYSTSATPGDETTYRNEGVIRGHDEDLTEEYHDYGVAWLADRIVHFVDQEPVKEWTDPSMLAAIGAGAPFYVLFALNINRFGHADFSEPWGETMDVDRIQLWSLHQHPTGRGSHYFWVRSANGEIATFTFRASGGNIELDIHQNDSMYWVTEDQTIAGGAVSATESLPGFWYDGELTAFTHSGPLEVFIDNQPVDPEQLSESTD